MIAYRLLTAEDGSIFCHKVTAALAKGWVLFGQPTMTYDASRCIVICGQAVTKEVDGDYDPDTKLGAL